MSPDLAQRYNLRLPSAKLSSSNVVFALACKRVNSSVSVTFCRQTAAAAAAGRTTLSLLISDRHRRSETIFS